MFSPFLECFILAKFRFRLKPIRNFPNLQNWFNNLSKAGIFLGLILVPNISPFTQLKNEQKLPKMVYIIPNFLVLHFGENFMKMRTKIAKLKMDENLYKSVNHSHFYAKFQYVLIHHNICCEHWLTGDGHIWDLILHWTRLSEDTSDTNMWPCLVMQSVASLTADPGVMSSIPACSPILSWRLIVK